MPFSMPPDWYEKFARLKRLIFGAPVNRLAFALLSLGGALCTQPWWVPFMEALLGITVPDSPEVSSLLQYVGLFCILASIALIVWWNWNDRTVRSHDSYAQERLTRAAGSLQAADVAEDPCTRADGLRVAVQHLKTIVTKWPGTPLAQQIVSDVPVVGSRRSELEAALREADAACADARTREKEDLRRGAMLAELHRRARQAFTESSVAAIISVAIDARRELVRREVRSQDIASTSRAIIDALYSAGYFGDARDRCREYDVAQNVETLSRAAEVRLDGKLERASEVLWGEVGGPSDSQRRALSALAAACVRAGRRELALGILDRLQALDRSGSTTPFHVRQLMGALVDCSDPEQALCLLPRVGSLRDQAETVAFLATRCRANDRLSIQVERAAHALAERTTQEGGNNRRALVFLAEAFALRKAEADAERCLTRAVGEPPLKDLPWREVDEVMRLAKVRQALGRPFEDLLAAAETLIQHVGEGEPRGGFQFVRGLVELGMTQKAIAFCLDDSGVHWPSLLAHVLETLVAEGAFDRVKWLVGWMNAPTIEALVMLEATSCDSLAAEKQVLVDLIADRVGRIEWADQSWREEYHLFERYKRSSVALAVLPGSMREQLCRAGLQDRFADLPTVRRYGEWFPSTWPVASDARPWSWEFGVLDAPRVGAPGC